MNTLIPETKLIREGRMGAPKCYKTGSIVSTYPKPMIVFEWDEGGLDVVKAPITYIKPDEITKYCVMKTEELPSILCVDFTDSTKKLMNQTFNIEGDSKPFKAFHDVVNAVANKCPWRCAVLDTIGGLQDAIYSHVASIQASALGDPRKWASMVGMKVKQTVSVMTGYPCHTVFIVHCALDKNELNSSVSVEPIIYSRFKETIGGLLSQFFYQEIDPATKLPTIWTKSQGFVKGIGARWPDGLKDKVGPNFDDIYGQYFREKGMKV